MRARTTRPCRKSSTGMTSNVAPSGFLPLTPRSPLDPGHLPQAGPSDTVIGWDLGGVHVKAALIEEGRVRAVVQAPAAPGAVFGLSTTLAELPDWARGQARHAVTMTGELTDCFRDRTDGVGQISGLARRICPAASRSTRAAPASSHLRRRSRRRSTSLRPIGTPPPPSPGASCPMRSSSISARPPPTSSRSSPATQPPRRVTAMPSGWRPGNSSTRAWCARPSSPLRTTRPSAAGAPV